jgi:hypothetical protein
MRFAGGGKLSSRTSTLAYFRYRNVDSKGKFLSDFHATPTLASPTLTIRARSQRRRHCVLRVSAIEPYATRGAYPANLSTTHATLRTPSAFQGQHVPQRCAGSLHATAHLRPYASRWIGRELARRLSSRVRRLSQLPEQLQALLLGLRVPVHGSREQCSWRVYPSWTRRSLRALATKVVVNRGVIHAVPFLAAWIRPKRRLDAARREFLRPDVTLPPSGLGCVTFRASWRAR